MNPETGRAYLVRSRGVMHLVRDRGVMYLDRIESYEGSPVMGMLFHGSPHVDSDQAWTRRFWVRPEELTAEATPDVIRAEIARMALKYKGSRDGCHGCWCCILLKGSAP
jgi:hypothetical protein